MKRIYGSSISLDCFLASSPGVLQNRIATLEAELASLRKELLGHEAIDITVNVVGEQMNDRVLRNEKAFMLKLRLHESPPKSLGTPVAPPGVSRLMFGGDTHTHPVWPTLTLIPSGPYPVSYINTDITNNAYTRRGDHGRADLPGPPTGDGREHVSCL